jgi:drug/metabolite transporter (DMT)-like permease
MFTNRKALLAYLLVCTVWGSTYVAIAVAVRSLPPFLMGGVRFALAGLLVAAYVWWRGLAWPDGRRGLAHVAMCGVLFFLLGNGGVVWAMQFVPSGIASIYVVMVAIWSAVVDALIPGGGRLTLRITAGLVLGFLGSLLLVGATPAELVRADLRGPIALTIASLAWALGTVLMKRRPSPASPFANASVQMLAGGVAMTLAGFGFGEVGRVTLEANGVLAFVYLILVGSLVGFGAYAYAIQHMSPTALGTYAYVNPVVAVLLGRVLLGETISRRMVVAMILMIGGAAIVQLGDGLARAAGANDSVPERA